MLWGERVVRSVANLTSRDGEEFLALAARLLLQTRVQQFPLEQANEALAGSARGPHHRRGGDGALSATTQGPGEA